MASAWHDDSVILYDGACVFCSGWVRFVARRDTERRFRFTTIQSPYGRAMALTLGIDPDDPDTNAVFIGDVAYRRSDAAIAVLESLPYWRWTHALRIVPRFLRDAVYTQIARNRYKLFGRQICDLKPHWLRDRVIVEYHP